MKKKTIIFISITMLSLLSACNTSINKDDFLKDDKFETFEFVKVLEDNEKSSCISTITTNINYVSSVEVDTSQETNRDLSSSSITQKKTITYYADSSAPNNFIAQTDISKETSSSSNGITIKNAYSSSHLEWDTGHNYLGDSLVVQDNGKETSSVKLDSLSGASYSYKSNRMISLLNNIKTTPAYEDSDGNIVFVSSLRNKIVNPISYGNETKEEETYSYSQRIYKIRDNKLVEYISYDRTKTNRDPDTHGWYDSVKVVSTSYEKWTYNYGSINTNSVTTLNDKYFPNHVWVDPNSVIVWATANEQAVVQYVVDEYNRTATDPIEVSYVAVAEGDTGTEVAKNPSAVTAPDLFLVADDHIYNLCSKNIITDLTYSYGTYIRSNNTETSVYGASYGNKIYGFPVTSDNGYFLWYNTEYISAIQANTFEGLLAGAKTTGKKVLLDIANGWFAPTFFFSPQVCGTDSLKFRENSDGDVVYDITWDSDNAVAAFNAVNALISTKTGAKGTYADNFTTGGNDAIVAGFTDRSVVAAVSGLWMYDDLKLAIGESNLAATKLPTLRVGSVDAQMATFTGSKVYCINAAKTGTKAIENRNKATILALLLSQKEAQLKRFEVRGVAPCNKQALASDEYLNNATIGAKALQAQVTVAAAIQSRAAEGRYWDVGKAIGQAMLDGNLGTYTSTKAFLKGECDILRKAA